MPRHYLGQNDLSPREIDKLLDVSVELRHNPRGKQLRGQTLVMFFEKTSTRTRLSFEIGMTQLGGHAVYLDKDSSQLSRGESLRDTAEVVSRYADMMMGRVNNHMTLVELSRHASIPVINGLSDLEHPMQSLGDLLTIRDHRGGLKGLKVAFVGDGFNNVTHSLMLACSLVGADIRVAAPETLQPDARCVKLARQNAERSGSQVVLTTSPEDAVAGADVVYTDTWVSMGHDAETEMRRQTLRPYRVNAELVMKADPGYIFMHCLPQHIGDEVTEDVAYGPHSIIFDQAENRLHVQKAMILFLLKGD